MPCDLVELCIEASDPPRLARFWAALLGWRTSGDRDALVATDDTGFGVRFPSSQRPSRTGCTST